MPMKQLMTILLSVYEACIMMLNVASTGSRQQPHCAA